MEDDAAEKLRKKNVDPKYIRHLDYCYLANGAVMYREVLNDEWLTDALVIPAVYEERAIAAFHDSGYGAHLGAHKTECAMREHVWFPKMKQKIRAYCDNCGACKTAKAFKRHHAGALKSTIYWEVFDDWAIDLQGPFLESVNGNKYHLHMVCLASNWNVSVAIPNKEARTVAAAIHKNLIIGGPCTTPKRIVSDKGSEFIAAVTEELFKQFGIKHLTSTAGHPTSNAVCERGHRTYGAIMRAFLHKYGVDWEDSALGLQARARLC